MNWLVESSEPILILTGQSGTGKSSLLDAYLIPELEARKPPFQVVKVRTMRQVETQLREALLRPRVIWTEPSEKIQGLATPELMEKAAARARQGGKVSRLLVVFDQFEEALILREEAPDELAALRALFNALTAKWLEGITVLLALRSDYRALLGTVGVSTDERTNWRELAAFSPSAATEFLTAKKSGISIEETRLRQVLKEAAALHGTPGLIRPIILNMLGRILQRLAGGPKADKPARALLMADVRNAIEHPKLRDVARQILPVFLTEFDTDHPRTVAEIHRETGLEEPVVLGFLQEFGLSGYVREIGREAQDSSRSFEISHDFVARLVSQVLKTPTHDVWMRLRPVLYLLSVIIWAVGIVALIAFYPWNDRSRANEVLQWKYHFSIAASSFDEGYSLRQAYYGFKDLAGARPWMLKLGLIGELHISGCEGLTSLKGFPQLQSLQFLDLSKCISLTNLEGLPQLQSLQSLYLSSCDRLTSLKGFPELQNLQRLDLSDCRGLTNLEGLPQLQSLQSLNLSGCTGLKPAAVNEFRTKRPGVSVYGP